MIAKWNQEDEEKANKEQETKREEKKEGPSSSTVVISGPGLYVDEKQGNNAYQSTNSMPASVQPATENGNNNKA